MKDHVRCLSRPQLEKSIVNLGGGKLPLADSLVRAVMLTVYAEQEGVGAAMRLRASLRGQAVSEARPIVA